MRVKANESSGDKFHFENGDDGRDTSLKEWNGSDWGRKGPDLT